LRLIARWLKWRGEFEHECASYGSMKPPARSAALSTQS
jgi:hypothetical protein